MRSDLEAASLDSIGALRLLREDRVPPTTSRNFYEREGSDRVSRGSVTLPSGGWWFSELVVPMIGDQSALLTIGRQGAGASIGPEEADLVIPPGEADAVLALLNGVIAQARSDGVLRDSPGDRGAASGGESGSIREGDSRPRPLRGANHDQPE